MTAYNKKSGKLQDMTSMKRHMLTLLAAVIVGGGTSLVHSWPFLMKVQKVKTVLGPCICHYVKLPSCVYVELGTPAAFTGERPNFQLENLSKKNCESEEAKAHYAKSLLLGLISGAVAFLVFGRSGRKNG